MTGGLLKRTCPKPWPGSARTVCQSRWLTEGTSTAGAPTGRAAETVVGHRNRIPGGIVDQEVPQVGSGPAGRGRRQAQLLVEVTVEQPALPVNADQGAAHHLLEIFAAVAGLQQLLVGLQLAPRLEPAGKALDRHVGQGVEAGEHHPVLAGQHPAVIGFQLGLGGRQGGALGVVDEVEAKPPARLAVAKVIELAQGMMLRANTPDPR